MLKEILAIAKLLALAAQWDLLRFFFELVRELRTELIVSLGAPQDKEI